MFGDKIKIKKLNDTVNITNRFHNLKIALDNNNNIVVHTDGNVLYHLNGVYFNSNRLKWVIDNLQLIKSHLEGNEIPVTEEFDIKNVENQLKIALQTKDGCLTKYKKLLDEKEEEIKLYKKRISILGG